MKARLDAWLRGKTGGLDPFPLVILFLLFFFDEFDTAAFNVLAPRIEEAFGLSDNAFATLVILNLSVVLLLAIPVGHYGDRLPRRRLVVGGAVLAGICSFGTGISVGLAFLAVARLGNGVGRLVNDPIHTSLLSDFYKPDDRPAIFSFHRNAVYVGTIFGSGLAGLMASLFSFRVAFAVLILPIVVTALVATRLKEPLRGGTDDETSALAAATEDAPPFGEAVRTLFAVRTLKRQYMAWVFIGAGLLPLAFLLPLFLDRTFHLSELERGLATAVNAAFTFAGVQQSGKWTARWLAKELGEPLRRAGFALSIVGVGIFFVAVTPWLWGVLVLSALTSFVAGIFGPPFFTTQALVSPARVRSLSFSFGSLFIVVGVWGLYLIPGIARLADHNIRTGLASTAPYWVVGGLVLASAGKFVNDDAIRAFRNLGLAAEMRAAAAAAGDTVLTCRGVEVAYDQVQVLFGIDMEIHEGEIVALLGTNGAGKSTLLRAISGLSDPIGGSIFLGGRDITHADAVATTTAGIVQVPGGRAVFPTLTVAEHLRAAGWLFRDDPERFATAVEDVMQTFPRLRERREQLAGNLSGGEQQMLALGMAFIAKPKLLMIDELSLGLAPSIVEELLVIVRRIRDEGTAIILVEQSINVALTVAERAYFLEKGEVRFEGPTSELLERDDIVRSVFLSGGTEPAVATDRPLHEIGTDVVLSLDDLSISFGGIRAVDSCSFELHKGEVLGLIGPNGAGKTTIFDLISGFLAPSSGRIVLQGRDITRLAPDKRAWLGLGRSFQDARLAPSLTVAENLALGLERHLEVRDHVAAALSLPGLIRQEEDVAYTVADLVELLNLGAFRDKLVRELSTGTRRVVDLAMCIAHDPAVLLLDEPSSGIAQKETEALGPLLLRIRDETGCGLLVIEHDMPLICGISDRMIALELGSPIAEGTPAEVISTPRVVAAYLGSDEATINRSGKKRTPVLAGHVNGSANGNGDGATTPARRQPRKAAGRR
jgi:ABC-type branched-subunit amino acid transport system ATPase component/predicted MFS family arabinose efflux permease